MKTQGKSYIPQAFTMAEIVVVIAVIAFAMLVVLPQLTMSNRVSKAPRIRCVNNLKQIGLAFRVWEGDNGDRYPMSVYTNNAGGPLYTDSADLFRYFQVMSNELSNPQILICPTDKKRRAATNFTTDFNGTHISFFVGLEADENFANSFLAGDSNITNGVPPNHGILKLRTNRLCGWTVERHNEFGNVGLADGSVQQFSTSALRTALQHTGLATNRLLMPDSPPK